MTTGKKPRAPRKTKRIGPQLVKELAEFARVLKTGGAKAVELQYRVSKPKPADLFPLPAYDADGVTRVRGKLGVTQIVFAAFLGVSVGTVRAWEQGTNTPSGPAARMLAEFEADPDHWRKKFTGR